MKIPEHVAIHVKAHLPGSTMINYREDKDGEGNTCYKIDAVKGTNYYHLKYSTSGKLMGEKCEPVFGEGYHEQYY